MVSALPGSILSYTPNLSAAVIYAVVYSLIGIALIWRCVRADAKWGLCLGIGALCEGIGFIIRIVFRYNLTSIGLYTVQQLVIVVSPACYFAFNYILFGRLAYNIERDDRISKTRSLTLIKAHHVGTFFVTSDVITFLMQIAGGGMQAISSLTNVGDSIFLAGIAAQFASYLIFLILLARMRFFVLPHLDTIPSIGGRIDRVLMLIAWSSIWIVVRCIFRTIELAQGYHGTLYNEEIYFLVLDALPLVLAIGPYLFFWPSDIISLDHRDQGFRNNKKYEMVSTINGYQGA